MDGNKIDILTKGFSKPLSVIALVILFLNPISALAENIVESTLLSGIGLRPQGMGGAFVAVADNVHAAYWNPAGLGDLVGFYFSWEKLRVEGIQEPIIDNLLKYNGGSLVISGLGYNWWNVRGDYDDGLGLEDLQIHLIGLGLGTEIGLNLGTAFKLLTHKDSLGWGLDFGVLAHISPLVSWGLNLQNLFEPTISSGLKVGTTTKTGLAFFPLANKYPEIAKDFILAVDADIGRSEGFLIHYGLEGTLFDESLALRVGFDADRLAFGASVGNPIFTVDYLGNLIGERVENSLGVSLSLGLGLEEKRYLSEYDFDTQDSGNRESVEEE